MRRMTERHLIAATIKILRLAFGVCPIVIFVALDKVSSAAVKLTRIIVCCLFCRELYRL